MSLIKKTRATVATVLQKLIGNTETINSQSITVLERDASGNILRCTGTVAVTDAGSGFAKGCLYLKTNVGAGTTGVYENVGTTTACNFDTIGAGGGGVTTFIGLSDVPNNYTGDADKILKVTTGETALEFVTVGGVLAMSATGVFSIVAGSIVNDDINAAAAIAWSKMAASSDVDTSGRVLDLTITGETHGDVLYRNATNWVRLAAGVAGQALITAGAGSTPYWGAPSVATASVLTNSVTCEAGVSDYTLAFGVAGGAYILTIPAVAGHRTFAFIDEAQTFSAVQTFTNVGLHILDTNATHDLIITPGSNLTADHILTITTGDADRTVTLAGALTTAADFITAGAFSLTLTATGITDVTLPLTGTLATLAGTEVLSGKTLTLPQINDTSSDHQYVFAVSELAADRNVTLPLLGGDDTFVFASFLQTLTNKTLSGNVATGFVYSVGGNAITFQDAIHTIVGRDTADTLTNKTIDCDGTGNVISNVNANELDPITMGASTYGMEFTITYNLTNQAAAVNIFNANAPFKFRVIDAYSISTSADGGTWKLNNGALGAGTDITDVITVAASDNDVDRIGKIVDAAWEIAQNGSLSVVPDGAGALDCMIFIKCMRVN